MCHGKHTPKPIYVKKEGKKRVPYDRTTKHKMKYEYAEDNEQKDW